MAQSAKRIALLTNGQSEHSWYLIDQLTEQNDVDLCVIATGIPSKSLHRRLSYARLWIVIKLFRLLMGDRFVPSLQQFPKHAEIEYIADLNSAECFEKLQAFQPEILVLSGTVKIADNILSCAPRCFNLHHGYVPAYRGVYSAEWAILERNYNFCWWTVHQATNVLDAGTVYESQPMYMILGEPLMLLRRRFALQGAKGMVGFLLGDVENQEGVIQPIHPNLPSRNFRKKDMSDDFEKQVKSAYYSKNMLRHIVTRVWERPTVSRALTPAARQFARNAKLANGFYVLNYHDICTELEGSSFKDQPDIYTSGSRFQAHLEYLKAHFTMVSLSEGCKLWREGKALENRYVAITFDDGLKTIERALEYCQPYGLVPTIFVNGAPVLQDKPLAIHRSMLCLRYMNEHARQGETYEDCLKAYDRLVEDGWHQETGFAAYVQSCYLSAMELKNLSQQTGQIEIGSHTMSHALLHDKPLAYQTEAIQKCHKELEEALDAQYSYFAYPFGQLWHRSFKTDYVAFDTAEEVFDCNGGINADPNAVGPVLRIGVQNFTVPQLDKYLRLQWVR